MSIKWFNRQSLTGGGVTALDAILTADIDDGDRAFILQTDGLFYTYEFDSSGTDAESSPLIIRPDDYTVGVWRLKRWSDAQPVGTLSLWLTDTPPDQHMIIYGADLSRSAYPELFGVWGEMFGSGDGSTTFGTPAPQGLFPRFTDNGAGIDPDASSRTDRGDGTTGDYVGTKQGDEYKAHAHTMSIGGAASGYSHTGANDGSLQNTDTTNSSGGNETRPKNMNFNLIVKYE